MPAPTTLRARMTLGVSLLCLGILTLTGIATYGGARAALRKNLDNALLSIAQAEIASAIDEPGGKVHVHNEVPGNLTLASGSGYEKFAQIENPADAIIARTHNLSVQPLQGEPGPEARARAGRVAFGDLRYNGQELRAVYYPLRDARGHPLITICAISKANMEQSLQSLRNTLFLIVTLSGILAAWGTSRLARRLTRPLEHMAQEARAISAASLHTRLTVPGRDAELRDLARILNDMLSRLEDAFAAQQYLTESQRRFLADASHELRSPLANLRGTVEIALRRPRSAGEYQETLSTSLGEIERLSHLVDDLLTLSRADTEQQSLHVAPCDLAVIAEEATAAHAARLEATQLHLTIALHIPLPVRGDAYRLRQILDNVLDNALRYAPPGSSLNVTARPSDGWAQVTIRDYGPGLSEEEQARVFDRFYRTDESRTRSTGGLGLGLSIASAFAKAHGGNLSVESTPGEGSAFTLSLPLDGMNEVAHL